MNSIINVGLVGYGISAKVFHAPFIATNNNFQLVSVVERNKQESKEKYPDVQVVKSIEELLQNTIHRSGSDHYAQRNAFSLCQSCAGSR